MNLIKGALRKPVTVIVSILAILFFSFMAIKKMRIDIFPQLGLPTVYVAQPYGGLSPEQMEGFITSYYEYHFLYITGVKFVESKSIQGAAIIKIQFQEGTDMSQAMAEVVGYVNRAKAFMPPGTVPPFITRFDAGSVPVGQLVFTSETRSLGEIADIALFKVRPMFATLPGVSAPPPFGGNQKTVIVKVNPDKVRDYNLSPDAIVQALAKANAIAPAGNIRIGDKTLITSQNTVVENVKELENVPLQLGAGASVYIRDIATVDIGSDVTTSYALVNGKRSIYIPVTKRSDASTWDVVKKVKAALPDMQAAVPDDIKVTYEFDQSGYVINSVKSLSFEGGLGAILTGIMVLLFLRDRRSALIVVLTIPLALLTGVTLLNLFGQTINIMTLGGLALSVGILVDMATVTIENIHQHLERGVSKSKAILNGCREVAAPLLLILLSILAVFTPALFMSGVPKGMFMPLSLSVGFAMIAAFILSLTFVPVAANWLLKNNLSDITHENKIKKQSRFEKFRHRYICELEKRMKKPTIITTAYLITSIGLLALLFSFIGTEIFPKVDAGQVQVRLRLPVGTRIERTETATQKLLAIADSITNGNIEISSAFVGTQPSSYPINNVYLWTSGPHESVIKINLKKNSGIGVEDFKEQLRNQLPKAIPGAVISFEPGDLVEQVLNLGSNNPIEIAVLGRDLSQTRLIAEKLNQKLKAVDFLRDVQISTPLDYPVIKMDIDRIKAGQLGLTVDQISKSTVAATSSSRFTQPNYWLDKKTGTAYQIQVEYPQYKMNSIAELELIPISGNAGNPIYLRDVASLKQVTSPGEYDRINQQRFITLTTNIYNKDLGSAVKEVNKAIASLGELPKGAKIMVRGQADLLSQTMNELQSGLLIAIVVIFLMLAVNFQSFKLSLSILSIIPAVVAGSILLLFLTGKTLNIQSYMGIIMAVGVAVANAILLITNAEFNRMKDHSSGYAIVGAFNRLRPILMTSLAMIAGMIPMAIGLGEGGDQTAPLAIAVIGGLLFSTISTLMFLPIVYSRMISNKKYINPSLDPEDENSKYYEASN
ncbi:MAG: efflux RND transporter permease subunit [Bacteroidia bacterium]|nr:efflux RND transporter permease subunit [Bacteroidia bacterium]